MDKADLDYFHKALLEIRDAAQAQRERTPSSEPLLKITTLSTMCINLLAKYTVGRVIVTNELTDKELIGEMCFRYSLSAKADSCGCIGLSTGQVDGDGFGGVSTNEHTPMILITEGIKQGIGQDHYF